MLEEFTYIYVCKYVYEHLYFFIQAVCSNSILSKFPKFVLKFKGWNKIPLVWSKFSVFENEKSLGL